MDAQRTTVGFGPLGRRIRHMGRLAQIANVFARHGMWSVVERLGIPTWLTPEQRRTAEELSRAEDAVSQAAEERVSSGPEDTGGIESESVHGLPARFRRSLEELGPAFVKLGQVLATREDLLGPEYIEELRKLHQNVEALPFEIIETRLKEELGPELLAQFKMIQPKPLAAGSIAQVHDAELLTGEKVVIKVQRPGIAAQIRVDLALMETVASLLERYIPESSFIRPRIIIEEFTRALTSELDFIREGGSTTKIGANLKDMPFIHVPTIYWNLTTQRVLTMSKLEGISAWDRETMVKRGLNPTILVDRGLGAFLRMVFVDGLFHGDLHPGNILALPNDEIGILDFGMVARLSRFAREQLAGLLLSLVNEDYDRMVQHFVELSDPAPHFNIEAFQHDIGNSVAPFVGLKLRAIRSGNLLWDLAKLAARHGVPLPQELIIFLKTLLSFEGIGIRLDPDFDVVSACEKFSKDIVSDLYSSESLRRQALVVGRDVASLLRNAPLQLRRLLKSAIDGQLRFHLASDDIAKLSLALDRSSSRLAVSIIIGALFIASSILTYARAGEEMYHLPLFGLVGFSLAGVLGLYVLWSVFRGGKF